MTKKNSNQIKYIELAETWGNAINEGNDKIANKVYKEQKQLLHVFEKDISNSTNFLLLLLDNSNLSIQYCALIDLKLLGLTPDDFEDRLFRIKNDPDAKLIGIMAHIDLTEYRKQKQQELFQELSKEIDPNKE